MTKNGSGIWRGIFLAAVLAGAMISPMPAFGQLTFPTADAPPTPNPLSDPTVKPGKMLLFDLEARFAKDVLARGGAAFAEWFAEDGVALGNGAAPLVGRVAIAKSANWDPTRDTARTPTASPSPPAAATSPSGASSPTVTGRWFWTRAATSRRRQATAASCPQVAELKADNRPPRIRISAPVRMDAELHKRR